MFENYLAEVRGKKPLVHCITNYVTANDVANSLLAVGASPIMADEPLEVAEITQRCDALTLNLGTLDQKKIESMLIAGKKANALGHPVVLDPVGIGSSRLRRRVAEEILKTIQVAVIRGNSSEIKALAHGTVAARGVDASVKNLMQEGDLEEEILLMQEFAKQSNSILLVTGAVDLACDGEHALVLRNGHTMMSQITGTGCQLSALVAAFLAANPADSLMATAGAAACYGLAGELAKTRLRLDEGTATYRNRLIDALGLLTATDLKGGVKYEIYS
ncbi:MAG: hydroxyethylthiazole kinase [Clostridium sp.]|nr:hydroxyethylthiazole kinase [Clostridium sp.]